MYGTEDDWSPVLACRSCTAARRALMSISKIRLLTLHRLKRRECQCLKLLFGTIVKKVLADKQGVCIRLETTAKPW